MSKVKVTLVKSLIGAKPNQKLTAKSLGLERIGDFRKDSTPNDILLDFGKTISFKLIQPLKHSSSMVSRPSGKTIVSSALQFSNKPCDSSFKPFGN